MEAGNALAVALGAQNALSPAKKLALSVWADDGGTVIPGSGGEVVFQAAQSPEWSEKVEKAAAERRSHRRIRLRTL